MSLHAIQRAKERLGLDVDQADLDAAVALCGADPRAVFVRKHDSGSELWIAPLKGVMAGLYVRRDKGVVCSVIEAWRASYPGKRGEYSRLTKHALKRKGKFGRRTSRLRKMDAMGVE